MKIIPAIDIRHGKTVRLLHGDYDQQTTYEVDPRSLAIRYAELSMTDLHLVDLDGALEGQPRNAALLAEIVATTSAEVQIGGGIRSTSHVEHLLQVGVSRVVIGSLAVNQPKLVSQWMADFGPERIVLAIDVRLDQAGAARVATEGWTKTHDVTASELIRQYASAGLKQILCTDIGRDGALSGPSIELYRALARDFPQIAIQASGGVSRIEDLIALRETGVSGAITGRALLEGHITDEEIRQF
ncbi:MAG: 1-(5-phosphoribosyl)-5-[(5-phosphoribosylamino)methylideneamino]imidazole-4-carboxamide isomerase [Pseudomonadota bacterium]